MPKPTFFNLPEGKRDALVQAALEEFASTTYHDASVSRLVARLGIAKGSIYQYFEDKQELYLYLVELASRTLLAEIGGQPADPDLFTTIRRQMTQTLAAAARHPLHARLLQQAYTSDLPFQDKIWEQAATTSTTHFGTMVADAVHSGQIRPDVDPDLVVMVISAVSAELGRYLPTRLGLNPQNPDPRQLSSPETERIYDQVMAVLRDGLAPRPAARGE